MTLDLVAFKKSIIEVVQDKLSQVDWKSLDDMVQQIKDHDDYSEELTKAMLSYVVTMMIVRCVRDEQNKRLGTN
jgi:hypothetical protein